MTETIAVPVARNRALSREVNERIDWPTGDFGSYCKYVAVERGEVVPS